mmetsp:Transcript_2159/g.7881  ORF Transcript_2159/g.7881 Transcript_2159/m.7881 type:complete len:388 (-) Transcript_2159:157-1320(-)|eukprot:CAMPEP_0117446888 /NCGR_PEP_ID=MMETSP0759-20121206/6582_1 /TAXON_ID=63605 /ORGANISM="Percolomonas cosmopolitus, Strain WS" /LENGTH=387 /DNA_ID=CAMNT_0005239187 /DNA_START=251 /DNA_END=1414 /DNA_ORIENTATION=-
MFKSFNRVSKRFAHSFKVGADYTLHVPRHLQIPFHGPNKELSIEKDKLISMYRFMHLVRQFELACDKEYKKRNIRGFLHLYSGQEAVITGLDQFAANYGDACITAYRCHAHQLSRGDSPKRALAELFGKGTGSSMGKGGSMHLYYAKNNFFGGNGIVGAQLPVGTGNGLALKQLAALNNKELENCSWVYYGDGASNQGQVFESYNMAKLWNLPVVFVCEDNNYGMGTSVQRSSASTDYYARGDYIPGIKCDGMDVIDVAEAGRYAKDWATKNGPVVLHVETYRYYGHSMSDPGISYRSRDEVQEVRRQRDPIQRFKARLLDQSIATEDDLKELEQSAKKEIKEAVEFAYASDFPAEKEFTSDILVDEEYVIRGRSPFELYHFDRSKQ